MNHYEKQLYSVFKNFDVHNDEALDRTSVLELCESLQLEDRGAALVDTLFERRADRVTFTQFRNGLLSVLGTEPSTSPPAPHVPNSVPVPQHHSDDDSSGREVAPKFVFGAKKYGRRSRPQHTSSEESPRHRVASDSRLDGERARQRMRCKRSASAMEHRDGSFLTDDEDPSDLDHDRRVDRERALALCRTLRMHGIDRRIVEGIFDDSATDEITVGEFFDRLNSSLTSSIAASLDGAVSTEGVLDDAIDVVPSDVVIEAWERAGVHRPRRLLLELGFSAAALRPADLEQSLEDELQALTAAAGESQDARVLLPLAAHAVARLCTERARRRLDVTIAERDKLRADLTEANRRARLLAQDVDENHARIEADLKTSLRQLEARHTEAARAAAAEAAAERERSLAARSALEEELSRRADSEVRLRADLNTLREQIEEIQRRSCGLEERAVAAEREVARLAAERRAASSGEGGDGEVARRAAVELEARADVLRQENQLLRDRNDELCAALEAATWRRARSAAEARGPACWRDERAASGDRAEDCDPTLSIDQRVSGHDEVAKRLRIIFESFQRLPAPGSVNCESCGTLVSTIATIQEKVHELSESGLLGVRPAAAEAAAQTDAAPEPPGAELDALRTELAAVRQGHHEDKENLSTIIKELESSLEQMKIEYDKCEDYWSCKLEEERAAHGEELRAGDERLAELAAHVAAYERQFRPAAAALPPIDERLALEAQVNDLQDEFAAYRRERDAELAELRARLAAAATLAPAPTPATAPAAPPAMLHCAELEGQLRRQAQEAAAGDTGAARWRQALGAREAAALRTRAARAERAVHRLHARLAAADLLVKDLYVENCRLAHLPRLP